MHVYIAPAKYSHRLQEQSTSSDGLREEPAPFNGLQEERARFLLPENADLAQALLGIILDRSCLERFSPDGGGAAVIILEDWQIDVLEGYGVIFKQGPNISPDKENHIIKANNIAKPEYISIDKSHSKSNKNNRHQKYDQTDEKSKVDILADWLSS